MDVDGLHNGVDTATCVTLSTDQTLHGHITFADLQVTEMLNVTGNIVAPHARQQLANPSLLQSNYIQTDCQFAQLIVNGPVFVHGTLHGVHLDAMLADAVYRSDAITQIAAFKTFDRLLAAYVQLASGLLNGIPVDQFMTLDTEQLLQMDSMSGNVILRELSIGGLFDFVNVTELDANAVRLAGDQYTEVELIFDQNATGAVDVLVAGDMNIVRTLNGIDLQTLVPIDEPIYIAGNVEIGTLLATNLDVTDDGQLIGLGVLNGHDLQELDTTRLSRTRSQAILAPYFVRSLRIVGDLEATDSVNDLPVGELQQHLQAMTTRSMPEYLANGQTQLQRLSVDGSVQLQRVNGHDFAVFINNAVWLDRENRIETVLSFERPLEVTGPLRTVNLNGLPFDDFLAGMVRRDRLENLQFYEVQTFVQSPIGVQTVNARRLGAIDAADILSVRSTGVANLTVLGNLQVDQLSVAGWLNGVDLTELGTYYVFDELNGVHVLHHPNVRFGPDVLVGSLWLHQATPNVSAFLGSLVPKDGPIALTGRKTFAGRVSFDQDLQVQVLNNIADLPALMEAMVFNEPNTSVRVTGDVAFADAVSVGRLDVDGDLTAGTIMGCDWTEWLRNGVRIDRPWTRTEPLYFVGEQSVRAENVRATFVNGCAAERMVTLNTEQRFNGTTRFGTVVTSGPVPVDGLVNGVDLRQEYANTLMVGLSRREIRP